MKQNFKVFFQETAAGLVMFFVVAASVLIAMYF